MNKIKVSLDNQSFMSKPTEAAVGHISNRIGRLSIELKPAHIGTLAGTIGLEGYTFCPATFKDGNRRKANFEQQQFFPLDFDNKDPNKRITFEAVKERAGDYGLPIAFAYDTFSSRNHDKFRVVFLNDVSITDIKTAEVMSMGLGAIFPEADSSCYKDVSKMYYGGFNDEMLYLYDTDDGVPTISAESLFRNFALRMHDRYGKNHYKTHIRKFANITGLPLTNTNLPDISAITAETIGTIQNGNFSTNSIKNINNFVEKLPNNSNSNSVVECTNVSSSENISYRSRDIGDIRLHCRLLRDFESGSRRLNHDERFGLATNLIHVYSGKSLFKSILRSNGCFDDRPKRYSEWDYYLSYMTQQKNNYKPKSCESYCPYADKCPHSANILTTAKPKYRQVERVQTYSYATLKEAAEQFIRTFREFINAKGFGWYVIKCQTAIGKTRAVLEFLKNTQLRVLLVVPTNVLKRDVQRRAEELGIDIIVSPSLHELEDQLPTDVWDDIKLRYDTGKSPQSYIKKRIKEDHPECAALFRQYQEELDEFNNTPGHTIATHRRLTHMDTSKYDLVIVDEDIVLSTILTNRGKTSIRALKKLKKELEAANLPTSDPLADKVMKLIRYLKGCTQESSYFTMPEIKYNRKAYAGIKMAVNIPALCAATHFCALNATDEDNEVEKGSVVFQIPVKFTDNTKYIMLSATANKTICEHVFGADNVTFRECDLADLQGTIYQDCSRPVSRGYIASDASIYDWVCKTTGVYDIISFKKFLEKGWYSGELTFSNCAGVDTLCGKNIGVVGTPHQTDWIYKLFAYAHGFGVDLDMKLKHHTTVVHNGFRFRFTTYGDALLRTIQFYIIESDLEQAVGRARLLREKCKVYLFSNFPLRQALIKGLDYDDAAAS